MVRGNETRAGHSGGCLGGDEGSSRETEKLEKGEVAVQIQRSDSKAGAFAHPIPAD